jgi:N-acetylglucosamine-6-phosphate deacetylase
MFLDKIHLRALPSLLILLFSLSGCADKSGAAYVEGLLYLDGEPVSVEIIDGKISRIKQLASGSAHPEVYLAPGLIDIQINGYMGVDFSDQELSPDMMHKATYALWKEGVTTFLPTVITRDQERLARSFSLLSEALEDEILSRSIPGFHLEGPYISPVKGYRGAHPEQYVRLPDWDEFSELQEKAQQGIKLITVAPEMEGALPFIRKCRESGVVVSLAHHNASPEIIEQAVEAGATLSGHLGNGCANEINRHHNPLWPQLSNDGLSISIISDGSHLTKEEVRTFYKVKGAERTLLVSDALSFAGQPPGIYEKDGEIYELTSEVVKFPSENVLAGAASPLSKCIENIMRFTQCSLGEAIRMASTNPARLMGLDHLGEIKEGKRADLILFTLEDGKMVIQKTWVAGKVVYLKE